MVGNEIPERPTPTPYISAVVHPTIYQRIYSKKRKPREGISDLQKANIRKRNKHRRKEKENNSWHATIYPSSGPVFFQNLPFSFCMRIFLIHISQDNCWLGQVFPLPSDTPLLAKPGQHSNEFGWCTPVLASILSL